MGILDIVFTLGGQQVAGSIDLGPAAPPPAGGGITIHDPPYWVQIHRIGLTQLNGGKGNGTLGTKRKTDARRDAE